LAIVRWDVGEFPRRGARLFIDFEGAAVFEDAIDELWIFDKSPVEKHLEDPVAEQLFEEVTRRQGCREKAAVGHPPSGRHDEMSGGHGQIALDRHELENAVSTMLRIFIRSSAMIKLILSP
jgi:hypothetical protein